MLYIMTEQYHYTAIFDLKERKGPSKYRGVLEWDADLVKIQAKARKQVIEGKNKDGDERE